jgi:hypothetical protein
MEQMSRFAFPGGRDQIEREARQLQEALGGRLSLRGAVLVLAKTKALMIMGSDKSEEGIVRSTVASTQGKLTEDDARVLFRFITGLTGPMYAGGDGSSLQNAVFINTTAALVGIPAEYDWITKHYGQRDKSWRLKRQALLSLEDKSFDAITIELADGSERTVYFDIRAFFRTFPNPP